VNKDILFWNVDTQKDFMNPDGLLYVKDAELIKPALAKITLLAEEKNIKTINTADYHTAKSVELSETPDFKSTFPKHCMAGTEGSEFIDETNPNKFRPSNYVFIGYNEPRGIPPGMVEKYRNLVLLKDHFDIFQGNPYANDIIATLKPKGIVVYGVATNVCVNFAVVGLLNRGYSVMVVKDAIKELPNLPVEPIYDDWRNRGALFVDADEIGGGL